MQVRCQESEPERDADKTVLHPVCNLVYLVIVQDNFDSEQWIRSGLPVTVDSL
jgi:hypothetical protein